MRFPGFIGPSYQLTSIIIDSQRCINMYPEMDETHEARAHEIGALIGTPGLSSPLVTLGAGAPIRCEYLANDGTFYVVANNTLYKVSSSWVATSVGTLNTQSGPVSMADNGVSLMLTDGSDIWTSTLGSGSMTNSNASFKATQVICLDGYFVLNIVGTNQYQVSDLNSTNLNPVNFASKESPDKIVGIINDHRNLWLFGQVATEVWYNTANPTGSPFSIVQGGYVEVGCAAAFSIQKIDNTVVFLGQDYRGLGVVYKLNGYQPERISTHAIELAIQSYGDISGTTSWTYQENGHQFYALNFASASGAVAGNSTWVYDLITGLWHERCYLSQGQLQRHLAQCQAYAFNTNVVGDYSSGNLYQMSSSVYSDNGNAIPRQRITPHLAEDDVRIFYQSLQIDFQAGVGLDGTGQGTSPQAMMQFSNDGGRTWSNEKWVSIGAIGATKNRAIWRRLGGGRDRVYKITVTDPVKIVMVGAEINLEKGFA